MIALDCDKARGCEIRALCQMAQEMMEKPHHTTLEEVELYRTIKPVAEDADIAFAYAMVAECYYSLAMALHGLSIGSVEREMALLEIAVEDLASVLDWGWESTRAPVFDSQSSPSQPPQAVGRVVKVKTQDAELETAIALLSEMTAIAETLWQYALDSGTDHVNPDVFRAANAFLASQPKGAAK